MSCHPVSAADLRERERENPLSRMLQRVGGGVVWPCPIGVRSERGVSGGAARVSEGDT